MAYTVKLFTPFPRLHAMGDFPDTGIGLAAVRHILFEFDEFVEAVREVDVNRLLVDEPPPRPVS